MDTGNEEKVESSCAVIADLAVKIEKRQAEVMEVQRRMNELADHLEQFGKN